MVQFPPGKTRREFISINQAVVLEDWCMEIILRIISHGILNHMVGSCNCALNSMDNVTGLYLALRSMSDDTQISMVQKYHSQGNIVYQQ